MFFETTLTTAHIEAMRTSGLWQDTHLFDSFAEKAAHLGDNPLVIDVDGATELAQGCRAGRRVEPRSDRTRCPQRHRRAVAVAESARVPAARPGH